MPLEIKCYGVAEMMALEAVVLVVSAGLVVTMGLAVGRAVPQTVPGPAAVAEILQGTCCLRRDR